MTEHGGRVRFAELQLSETEQERRIENDDRKELRKLASVETLRRIRAADAHVGEMPLAELTIDTELTSPADAARRLRDAFGLRA